MSKDLFSVLAAIGEGVLDEALKMMKVSKKMSVGTWIHLMSGKTWNVMKIGYQLKQVREQLAKGLGVIPKPWAMETVTEEEEEEEEGTTSNAIPKPTPHKRHPHSLIFNTRSTSTTPTGSPSFGFGSRTLPPSSNARPLRALSLSLSQSPSAQVHAPPAKLKPLCHEPVTVQELED